MEAMEEEKLLFQGGIGPIQLPAELNIRRLTIFIGPQGSGKSLASQLLYFFRDAEYLFARYSGETTGEAAVRKLVEGLRSGDLSGRALASFLTTKTSRVEHIINKQHRSISLHRSTRKILPLNQFKDEIAHWFSNWYADLSKRGTATAKAIYIPAERIHFSRFINADPGMLGHRALPITMREFSSILSEGGKVYRSWQDNPALYPGEAKYVDQLVHDVLRGRIKYSTAGPYAGKWQWVPQGSSQPIELEMASSGQMEAWPFTFTAQTLFGAEKGNRPLYLHVEEPEAHLHPQAETAIVQVLAYLVNQGIHVVLTTHSLTVLYAINNLLLAYEKLQHSDIDRRRLPEQQRVPPPEIRLDKNHVSAYLFDGSQVQSIFDYDAGQLDEGRLGHVLGDLEQKYSQLMTYKTLWE